MYSLNLKRKGNCFEEVYKVVRNIPEGKVMTYGQISRILGISPRTVGWALHSNKDPVNVPCHRVVNKDGRIAPGYVFGGQGEQRMKLISEGIEFIDDCHVNKSFIVC
ncbi:MAG: MGMT family protein [Bacteroidales bacterium]|nr:MGMT family protein [Bacteroidales bacterium]